MKKLIIPFILSLLFLSGSSFMLTQKVTESGNHNLFQENFKVKAFSNIHIGVSADVYHSVGNNHSVKVEGDQDDIDDLIVEVKDGALTIHYPKGFNKRSRLTINIVSSELEGVKISGSAKFNAKDDIKSEEMDLVISGSGKVNFGTLQADEVDVKISGSGDVLIDNGSADECDAIISGSGKLMAENFVVNEFTVKISGSGGCKITANKELDAIVSGSGSVYYNGSPTVNTTVSGSGKIRKL